MEPKVIAVAGASGNLGMRVVKALVERNVQVKALVRKNAPDGKIQSLKKIGADVVVTNYQSADELASSVEGVSCIVSTLLGLREVIVGTQSILLKAALTAGVPRFIPSDYSIDFVKLTSGQNRNLDLHREFQRIVDSSDISVTSILNGAFMDMLTGQAPMIQFQFKRVLFWENADQLLDFTTMDDTASFTAAAAIDESTPRFLRVAGEVTSARCIAETMTKVSGKEYKLFRAGSLNGLRLTKNLVKAFTPPTDDPFPAWQGMEYFHNMFEGRAKLEPLDNERYPEIHWTRLSDFMMANNMQ